MGRNEKKHVIFFMLHFQFFGPLVHRVEIQVDEGLWQISRSSPLEFSNYKFKPSKNNALLSLCTMYENPRRHEQVYSKVEIFLEQREVAFL